MTAILVLGFLLGLRHATDADHVVAVSTISTSRNFWKALLVGGYWGAGHTLSLMVIGAGIVLADWVIPVRAGLTLEFGVALMLTILGILNIFGVPFRPTERFDREKDEFVPVPQHWLIAAARPAFIGVVHGMAGSAAAALLVMSTVRDPKAAMLFLLVFGVGTIAGMMLITACLAASLTQIPARLLRIGSGILSLAFGLVLVYQIGYLGGLFTSHPVWRPH